MVVVVVVIELVAGGLGLACAWKSKGFVSVKGWEDVLVGWSV